MLSKPDLNAVIFTWDLSTSSHSRLIIIDILFLQLPQYWTI